MHMRKRSWLLLLWSTVLVFGMTISAFAHSGRTDSSGGHRDNKNKSGLGSYHYHCGGHAAHLHPGGYCPYEDIFPSRVSINIGKKTLGIGETVELSATVYPENACDTSVDWTTSDRDVAVVSGDTVVAKGYGTAVLTAETFNGKKKTVKITVKKIEAEKVSIKGLPSEAVCYVGETYSLKAITEPEIVDDPAIVWNSSDSLVAQVSDSGELTVLSAGEATIEACTSNGVKGKVKLKVMEKSIEKVAFGEEAIILHPGDRRQLAPIITPPDATHPELTYISKNPELVSVTAEGELYAINCGETTVTACSDNGISSEVIVRVDEVVAESLTVNGPHTLYLDDTGKLTASFSPADTTDQTCTWTVDDSNILTISEDGSITATAIGSTIVRAIGKDVQASFAVEICPVPVERLVIIRDDASILKPGRTTAFNVSHYPTNAEIGTVTWSTNDPDIATINQNGTLTANKGGEVIITAKSENGTAAYYTLQIEADPMPAIICVAVIVLSGTASVLIFNKIRKQKREG